MHAAAEVPCRATMSASAGTGVFVLSLLSIPICYSLNSLLHSDSTEALLFVAFSTFLIFCLSARFLLRNRAPLDPLFYVYAGYSFLSVVNLIIALEQDSIIDGFVTFYLREAEPHINTAHGHMISYWDGCVHYPLYLVIVAAITWGDSYRTTGLYWVGSFLTRAIVYILGNAVGKYGTQVNALFLLHIVYILVSVWACFRIFSQPSTRGTELTSIKDTERKSFLHSSLDLLFVVFLIPAAAFCVFRGLIALDCSSEWCQDYTRQYEPYLKDPSAYPKVQMLVNMLYFVPFYIAALYALTVPGCEWMPDLTLVHAGALAQAQFTYIGASIHTRTPFSYRVPADGQLVFLLINVLYALVPQALCYRCCSRPAFFLKTTSENKKAE